MFLSTVFCRCLDTVKKQSAVTVSHALSYSDKQCFKSMCSRFPLGIIFFFFKLIVKEGENNAYETR